ncbi:hypothetical protein E2562_016895 [Oryza meyeriana var. granulata]|uniref:Uncharacterized protein n=1 Tax=Oryza meyeriana var. granulata TaxID=110450 RepID=A0A6G1DWT9_9ORYZ|nr:hypothetical protein E2562_016895 [Oryza meyeriana var. granulata]
MSQRSLTVATARRQLVSPQRHPGLGGRNRTATVISSASSFSQPSVSHGAGSRDSQVSDLLLVTCLFYKGDSSVVERTCRKPDNFNRKFYRYAKENVDLAHKG